jgi:CBS domain-containing protein
MTVDDVLRAKGSRIIAIHMNETVEAAAKLLLREKVGALVVRDEVASEGHTIIGMFSERDIVRAIAMHSAAGLKLKVAALMSMNVISCRPTDTLDHVRQLMDRNHIRHVPVLDEFNLVGVISVRDLIAVLESDPAAAPTLFASARSPLMEAKN